MLNMNINNWTYVSRTTQFLIFHFLRTGAGALLHRLYPFTCLHNQEPAQNNLWLVLSKVKETGVVVGHNACPLDAHRVAYFEAHVQQKVQYLQFTCLPWICDFSQIWNKMIVLYVFDFFMGPTWSLEREAKVVEDFFHSRFLESRQTILALSLVMVVRCVLTFYGGGFGGKWVGQGQIHV